MPETIEYRLTAETRPFCLTKREIGCVNIGVYCDNPECGEFLAIMKEANPDFSYIIVLQSPLLVRCDHCHTEHRYAQDRIEHIFLNTQNIRRVLGP